MKKILMIAFMGMTAMSFSRGINFKGGFDSYRTLTGSSINKASQGSGFVLGLEGIPLDERYYSLGLGIEYAGGLYLNKYDTKINNIETKAYAVPIYGLVHANVYKNEYASVYPFARLGYAISKLDNGVDLSGVYYGLGFGVNIKNFIFEGLYDGIYGVKSKVATHKFGIRLGYSLDFDKMGLFDKKEKPVMKIDAQKTQLIFPEMVEVIDLSHLTDKERYEIGKAVKEANATAPIKEIYVDMLGNVFVKYSDDSTARIDSSKTVMLKASKKEVVKTHTMVYKEYVIHGFRVNGEIPTEKEQQRIHEIVGLLNKHAINGVVNIVGYTDSIGRSSYNKKLSIERAEKIAKLLRKNGLKSEIKFGTITGKGESNPSDTNSTKEGRYNNRRVVLTFDKLIITTN